MSEKQAEQKVIMDMITQVIRSPGIRVNREAFLREIFQLTDSYTLRQIVEKGPVAAGYDRLALKKQADRLVQSRTLTSSGVSFAAGLPGGLIGISAGVAADTVQFFAAALRLAQELSYFYGAEDLWSDGAVNTERVQNQLMLYLGVMFGVREAAAAVRVTSSPAGQAALAALPGKTIVRTMGFPVVKSIAKVIGTKMTRNLLTKGVSKAVPLVGGVISGSITYATLRPMGLRLVEALDTAAFEYTEDALQADWYEITEARNDD